MGSRENTGDTTRCQFQSCDECLTIHACVALTAHGYHQHRCTQYTPPRISMPNTMPNNNARYDPIVTPFSPKQQRLGLQVRSNAAAAWPPSHSRDPPAQLPQTRARWFPCACISSRVFRKYPIPNNNPLSTIPYQTRILSLGPARGPSATIVRRILMNIAARIYHSRSVLR